MVMLAIDRFCESQMHTKGTSISNKGGGRGMRGKAGGLPESSRAPRAYSVSRALSNAAVGGRSMKSKASRSSKPRAFSCRATVARLTRWISGKLVAAS